MYNWSRKTYPRDKYSKIFQESEEFSLDLIVLREYKTEVKVKHRRVVYYINSTKLID
jgi:hypothetical protein